MSAKSRIPVSKTKAKAKKWRQKNLNMQAQSGPHFHQTVRTHHGHITRENYRLGIKNLQFHPDSRMANVTQVLPEAAA